MLCGYAVGKGCKETAGKQGHGGPKEEVNAQKVKTN